MDTSKLNELSKGQKIAGGAGLGALIASFLPWYTLNDEFIASISLKGTDFTFGWMGMVLLMAASAITVAPAFGKEIGNDQVKGEQIALGLAGLGALLWVIRFVSVPGVFLDTMGRGFGLFVAIAAAAGVVAGVVMTMKEKGIDMPNADTFKSLQGGVKATTTTATTEFDGTTAPTQPVAPAPVQQHPAPTPVQHPAPTPVQHTAPVQHPAPVQHTAPAPQQNGSVQF